MKPLVRLTCAAVLAAGVHLAALWLIPDIMPVKSGRVRPDVKEVVVTLSCPPPAGQKSRPDRGSIAPQSQAEPETPPVKKHTPENTDTKKPEPAEKMKPGREETPPAQKKKPDSEKKSVASRRPLKERQSEKPDRKTRKISPTDTFKPGAFYDNSRSSAVKEKRASERSPEKTPAVPSSSHREIEMACPLYKSNPLPEYPRSARRRGLAGIVELMVRVDENGLPRKIRIQRSSGWKSLDRAALESVQKWRFHPGRINGDVEAMWVHIPVEFKLE